MKTTGYLCKKYNLNLFFWGDYYDLSLKKRPYQYKSDPCAYCDNKKKCSKPRKVVIDVRYAK